MNLEKFETRHDGRPTSPEMLDILKRLDNGENVSNSEIESTPEVIEARQQISEIISSIGTDSTANINTEERQAMRAEIRERLESAGSVVKDEDGRTSLTGEVREGRRADIVIGLPAAGKSSVIVDRLSEENKSKIIDSDDVKKETPEFHGGTGATIVHAESSAINIKILEGAISNGQNIVLPIIGSNPDSVKEKYIDNMKEQGYKVFVHYVEVSPDTAKARMLGRYITDGRFVDYKNLEKYTDQDGNSKCDVSFEVLKNDPDVEGFTDWNNDVEEGSPAILVESRNMDVGDSPRDVTADNDTDAEKDVTSENADIIDSISFEEEPGSGEGSVSIAAFISDVVDDMKDTFTSSDGGKYDVSADSKADGVDADKDADAETDKVSDDTDGTEADDVSTDQDAEDGDADDVAEDQRDDGIDSDEGTDSDQTDNVDAGYDDDDVDSADYDDDDYDSVDGGW